MGGWETAAWYPTQQLLVRMHGLNLESLSGVEFQKSLGDLCKAEFVGLSDVSHCESCVLTRTNVSHV